MVFKYLGILIMEMGKWGGNIRTKCALADHFGEEAGGFQFTSQYALPEEMSFLR